MSRRPPFLLLLLLLLIQLLPALGHAADRAGVATERQRLEAGFAAEEAQCRERFAVTACIDDVRQRRRIALAGPRAQELAQDDAERLQRAQSRREAVARKQKQAAERPIVEAEPVRELRLPPPPAPLAEPRVQAAPPADEAARRAAASRERREKIAASQDRIVTRQVERASRNKKPGEALPLPPEVAASRARR